MAFLTPLFLLGLAAIAAPVLLHLVRRIKAKPVAFSSLMFLRAVNKEQVRRRRLRDMLLLALRVALLALLAFAFARPFLQDNALPFASGEENESIVLLIDRSYSMQYEDRFEKARQEALDRIDELNDRDELAVIVFDESAEVLTALGDDREIHRTVVQNALAPSNQTTDFHRAFRVADELLTDAVHERRVVVLISDFQLNAWSGAFENWKLDPGIDFVPVTVADAPAANGFVDAFELTQTRTGEQVALRADALVRQDGEGRGNGSIELSLANTSLERRPLPQRPVHRVSLQHFAPREGVLQGAFSLNEDALDVDDRYYFTVPVEARPSLLVVQGESRERYGDALFLRNAFSLGEEALYDLSEGGLGRLTRTGLREVQVLFLANVPRVSDQAWGVIRQYVEEGGNVVLSFGDAAASGGYDSGIRALGLGQLDDARSGREASGQDAIIGEVDLRHPVFRLFDESGAGSIFRPIFRRYMALEADSAASVIGRYDNGDPFLVERRVGRGKAMVYTSTWSTSWTDFPIHEVYLPFLYETVRYLLEEGGSRRTFTVGESVPLDGRPGDVWEVAAPGNRVFRVELGDTGRGRFLETDTPGHYEAALGRSRFAFSVNVDTRESRLEARDPEEAYAAVVQPRSDVARSPDQVASLDPEDAEGRQKIWRYLIFLALALFLAESLLANRQRPTP